MEKHGIPQSIYTDRFSTYKNNHPESPDIPTQFGRVCASFGIDLICTKVPGCVEDYLVKYYKFFKGLFLGIGIIHKRGFAPKVSPVFA